MPQLLKILSLVFSLLFLLDAVAAADELLIADRSPTSPNVSRYDVESGEYLGELIGNDLATNGGLLFPSAMTMGPNDELFVASLFNNSVMRYDSNTGEFLGTFATELNVPSGLLYNEEKDEMLIATLGNFDSELILQYQASTGELLGSIGEGTGMSGRGSMTVGPDGNVYASSFANGEFFLGSVLEFDATTLEVQGTFASNPLLGLAGASGLVFHEGTEDGSYQLDVVGLFSNNVARFEVSETEEGLTVGNSSLVITEGLDFPSAVLPLNDGTMLVTNLGNDNVATGELRPGSISRYDIATGEFIDTYLSAGGPGMLSQPNALLLVPDDGGVPGCDFAEQGFLGGDFDGDGQVVFADFVVLSANYGQMVDNYTDGDVDCNGEVGFTDFLTLSQNFGGDFETAAVPEPAGWLTGIAAMMSALVFRRRRGEI